MDNHNNSTSSQRRDVAEIVEQEEVELMVKKAIAILPETSRVAITLYYAGGMNQSEIASQLGLSQVSISEKIKSGLEKVKAYLKKAGIQSAIVLSPNLVQEGILSISPPKDLILKLANSFPTETQFSLLSSASARLGVSSSRNIKSLAWVWFSLLFLGVIFSGYFYWPSKSENISLTVIKKAETLINNKERIFTKVDFSNYEPIIFTRYKVQKNIGTPGIFEYKDIQMKSDERKWTIGNDLAGGSTLIRGPSAVDTCDGLYINKTFTQAHLFKCKLKVYPGEKKFGFVLKLPISTSNGTLQVMPLNSEKFLDLGVSNNFSDICQISSEEGGELEIKIYIWLNKNEWRTASFFQVNGNSKKYFSPCSLMQSNTGFRLGLYSNTKLEGSNFEYTPLDVSWDIRNEPDIKEMINEFPKDFLPEANEK